MKLDRGVTLLAILLAIASHVAGQDNTDWPAFRGTQGKGITDKGPAPRPHANTRLADQDDRLEPDWLRIQHTPAGQRARS